MLRFILCVDNVQLVIALELLSVVFLLSFRFMSENNFSRKCLVTNVVYIWQAEE
jgi:hypothetical protein